MKIKRLFLLLFLTGMSVYGLRGQQATADVYYEIFVRSFYDSNGDGVGDINGITDKLDYLKELGITGIWITPVHPSPTYHKYDVTDYLNIDPEYGSLDDYKKLVNMAHKKGIKILLDLVVNHTSRQHPWFIESCHNNPQFKDYYVWSDTVKTAQGWHSNPLNPEEKYYGFFWEGMPDLNFDNPAVRKEISRIGTFWVKEVGVDGFRLDAAQHIYDATEVDKNNAWWTEFRKEMQQVKPDVQLIGEVWNKDSVTATYLKTSLDACFNFDLSKAITRAVSEENADSMVMKLLKTDALYRSYNPNYTDAIFISNHDQDRYRSIFNNDTAKTRLAFAILMTLPGTPYLYYGEELGMTGKFPDHLRREPMIWNGPGTTSWEKPQYTLSSNTMNVQTQLTNPGSFYHAYHKLIALRKSVPALSRGKLSASRLAAKLDKKLLVYELKYEKSGITVIHNVTGNTVQIPKSPDRQYHLLNGANAGNTNIILPPYSSVVFNNQ